MKYSGALLLAIASLSFPGASTAHCAAITSHAVRIEAAPDPGVDLATVKTVTALFTEPSSTARKIENLRRGDWAVLASRQAVNGWFNVVSYASGRQGWVRADRLSVQYTQHPAPSVQTQVQQSGTDGPPHFLAKNSADRPLYLHVAGVPEIIVPPHSEKNLEVPAGICNYNAAYSGLIPKFGFKEFVRGDDYVSEFHIVKGSSPQSTQARMDPRLKADAGRLQATIDVQMRALSSQKSALQSEKATLDQLTGKIQSDQTSLEARKASVDRTNQASVDEYNASLTAIKDEESRYDALETQYNQDVDAYNSRAQYVKSLKQQIRAFADSINSH